MTALQLLRQMILTNNMSSGEIIKSIDLLLDYEEKLIREAWEDGQGNIPQFAGKYKDDYFNSEHYFKSNYATDNQKRDIRNSGQDRQDRPSLLPHTTEYRFKGQDSRGVIRGAKKDSL